MVGIERFVFFFFGIRGLQSAISSCPFSSLLSFREPELLQLVDKTNNIYVSNRRAKCARGEIPVLMGSLMVQVPHSTSYWVS